MPVSTIRQKVPVISKRATMTMLKQENVFGTVYLCDCITSAQRYIRPTILWTYPHVVFQQLIAAVGPTNCMSDPTFENKLVYTTYCMSVTHLTVGRMHCIAGQ